MCDAPGPGVGPPSSELPSNEDRLRGMTICPICGLLTESQSEEPRLRAPRSTSKSSSLPSLWGTSSCCEDGREKGEEAGGSGRRAGGVGLVLGCGCGHLFVCLPPPPPPPAALLYLGLDREQRARGLRGGNAKVAGSGALAHLHARLDVLDVRKPGADLARR